MDLAGNSLLSASTTRSDLMGQSVDSASFAKNSCLMRRAFATTARPSMAFAGRCPMRS
jgi:hypothetical protein